MSGVSGNINSQVTGNNFYTADQRQKTSYNAPLLWILGGAAAASTLAYLYFGNDENENPLQLADFGSLLTDIAVSTGTIAASIASIPLTIYATIMAAKDNQVNFNNDLSNRDLQKVDHLSEELVHPYDQLPSPQAQSGKYKRDRSNRNSKRGTSQNNSQGKQHKVKKTRAESEVSPMIPKTGDITLNSGSCTDAYSSKVLNNGNIATACTTRSIEIFPKYKIYLNIDNSAGSVVSAPMLISDDEGYYPDLVQELTSENIGIAWIDKYYKSIQYTIHNPQGQIIKTRTEAFASTEYIVSRRYIGVKGDNFFSFHDDGEYIYWQEIASSNGDLVGSLTKYRHSTFNQFEFPEPDEMTMVEAGNGNIIAMYRDKSNILKRQAFTLAGYPAGVNIDLGASYGSDMVALGNKVYGVRQSGANIFLDKSNENGMADGGTVIVATDATGNPRIASNKNYIAVAYPAPDGGGNGVFAQIYDKDITAVGSRFRVNANTAGHQTNPQVSWTPEGGLTVFFLNVDTPTMRTFKFNSPPVPNSVPPETIFVNQPFNKTYTAGDLATDPDQHLIAFTDEGGVPWGNFNASTLTLNLTAPLGSQGNYNWFFGGDDGNWNGTFTRGRIPFTVANRAPTITGSTMISGFPFQELGPLCLTKGDLDQDTPLTTKLSGKGVLNGTDCWTFTPGSDDIGIGTVNVTVADPLGAKGFHVISWEGINRNPFVNKGFGNHNVTAGDSFAIVVADDAYDDLDEHATFVADFGNLENWMIADVDTQSLTGSAPINTIGQTFNIHPTFCDSYASCGTDSTGTITVLSIDGNNAIPSQVKNFPSHPPIGSGWNFFYRLDIRDYFIDLENDPLIASVTSPFGRLPKWFENNVTSDVIVNFWGKSPNDFIGPVIPIIEVRDSEHPNGISEPITFNIVDPETLAPKIDQIISELIFDVGKERWIQLPSDIFYSPTGSAITLSMETESAGLDNTWSHYKKTKWLKITQDNQGNWLIGGKPGKKATNGAKVALMGCDDRSLCATQQFFVRVEGESPFERFVTYGSAAVVFIISSGIAYWWKYGRNGEWRNHKRTVEHYCGEKKDQIKRCWAGNNANKDISLQSTGSLNENLLDTA